jgi:hypothetical protein
VRLFALLRFPQVGIINTRKQGRTVLVLQPLDHKTKLFEYTGTLITNDTANKLTNNVYMFDVKCKREIVVIDGSSDMDVTTDPFNAAKLINTFVRDEDAHQTNCEFKKRSDRPRQVTASKFILPTAVRLIVQTTRAVLPGEFLCVDYGRSRKRILAEGIALAKAEAKAAAKLFKSNQGAAQEEGKKADLPDFVVYHCPYEVDSCLENHSIRWFQPRTIRGFAPNTSWYVSMEDVMTVFRLNISGKPRKSDKIDREVLPVLRQRCHSRYAAAGVELFTHPQIDTSVLSCLDVRELLHILSRTPPMTSPFHFASSPDMYDYLIHMQEVIDSDVVKERRAEAHPEIESEPEVDFDSASDSQPQPQPQPQPQSDPELQQKEGQSDIFAAADSDAGSSSGCAFSSVSSEAGMAAAAAAGPGPGPVDSLVVKGEEEEDVMMLDMPLLEPACLLVPLFPMLMPVSTAAASDNQKKRRFASIDLTGEDC